MDQKTLKQIIEDPMFESSTDGPFTHISFYVMDTPEIRNMFGFTEEMEERLDNLGEYALDYDFDFYLNYFPYTKEVELVIESNCYELNLSKEFFEIVALAPSSKWGKNNKAILSKEDAQNFVEAIEENYSNVIEEYHNANDELDKE